MQFFAYFMQWVIITQYAKQSAEFVIPKTRRNDNTALLVSLKRRCLPPPESSTQKKLIPPQRTNVHSNDGHDRQVDEPHQTRSTEVKQKVQLLRRVFVLHRGAQLPQEPEHHRGAAGKYQPAGPRLILVNVGDNINFRLKRWTLMGKMRQKMLLFYVIHFIFIQYLPSSNRYDL